MRIYPPSVKHADIAQNQRTLMDCVGFEVAQLSKFFFFFEMAGGLGAAKALRTRFAMLGIKRYFTGLSLWFWGSKEVEKKSRFS